MQPLMVLKTVDFNFLMNASKRGSVMVEAAILLPLVVIMILLLFSYAIKTYEEVSEKMVDIVEVRNNTLTEGNQKGDEAFYMRTIDFVLEGALKDQ